jgi:hypothetical protein
MGNGLWIVDLGFEPGSSGSRSSSFSSVARGVNLGTMDLKINFLWDHKP